MQHDHTEKKQRVVLQEVEEEEEEGDRNDKAASGSLPDATTMLAP